jgi:hypothetical protein
VPIRPSVQLIRTDNECGQWRTDFFFAAKLINKFLTPSSAFCDIIIYNTHCLQKNLISGALKQDGEKTSIVEKEQIVLGVNYRIDNLTSGESFTTQLCHLDFAIIWDYFKSMMGRGNFLDLSNNYKTIKSAECIIDVLVTFWLKRECAC